MSDEIPISLHAQREHDPDGFARRIDEIRKALWAHLDHVSLRQASREVGMSATGLSNFLHGSQPYMPTVAKLGTWYDAHVSAARSKTNEA